MPYKKPVRAAKPTRSLGELVQAITQGTRAPRRAGATTVVQGSNATAPRIAPQPVVKEDIPTHQERTELSSSDSNPPAVTETGPESISLSALESPSSGNGKLAGDDVVKVSPSAVNSAPNSAVPTEPLMTPDAAARLSSGSKHLAARAQELVNELVAAGQNRDRIRTVIETADSLPSEVWQEDAGKRLQAEVGKLVMHGADDLKRLAVAARRRWRLTSSAAHTLPLKASPGIAEATTAGDGGA